nr:ABC transporter substrate-binding protein [Leucobacter weissii]
MLALTACTGGDPGAEGTGETAESVTVQVELVEGAPLDPYQTDQPASIAYLANVVDSLTYLNPESRELEPSLATAWEVSDDSRVFTFQLREGVTFSDGEALDAEAVKRNFEGALELGAAAVRANYLAGLESVEATGPQEVQLTFSEPNAPFLTYTASTYLGILSPQTWELAPEERSSEGVVGTGPFVIDDYAANQFVELAARDDYDWAPEWAGRTGAAAIKELRFEFVSDSSTRAQSLSAGQADIAQGLTVDDATTVESAGGSIEIATVPGIPTSIALNTDDPVLQDPAVREALNLAIDRTTISEGIFNGAVAPAYGLLTESLVQYVPFEEEFTADVARAKSVLDEAGWTETADGVREKDGTPLQLTLDTVSPYSYTNALVQLVQSQFAEIGVGLEVVDLIATGEVGDVLQNGGFQALMSNTTDLDGNVLYGKVSGSEAGEPGASNSFGLQPGNELYALLNEQRGQSVEAERTATLEEAQRLIVDENLLLPLTAVPQVYGLREGVSGIIYNAESRPLFYAATA